MTKESLIKFYYPFTAFITGAVIMVLEILGFRLFAPYFGYSVYVWGSLIGIVMLALACGYYAGGRLADRYGRPLLLYLMIGLASFYILVIRVFSQQILSSLIYHDIIAGTLLASLIIFGLPMFLLSMVSPFIIGIRAQIGHVGTTAGTIYGISTAGSILGTFLAAFYFIPSFGTNVTLLICFFTILVITFFGILFWSKKAWLLVLFIPLSFIPPKDFELNLMSLGRKPLFNGESKYARLFVFEDGKNKSISLEAQFMGAQSLRYKDRLLTGYYWDYFNLSPLLIPSSPPRAQTGSGRELRTVGMTTRYLLLGVAGGTSIVQLRYFFPDLKIDAVEIDEKMIELGTRFFGLTRDAKTTFFIDDVRPFLARSQKKYPAIGVDLFTGGVFVPFYVSSREFFQSVFNHLENGGHMLINVADPSKEKHLSKAIINTMTSVFESVFYVTVSDKNKIILAFPQKISAEEIKARLQKNKIVTLNPVISKVLSRLTEVKFNPQGRILTDDLSPIDKLAYASMQEYRSKNFKKVRFNKKREELLRRLKGIK